MEYAFARRELMDIRKSQSLVPMSKMLAKGQKLRNGLLGERRVMLPRRPVPGRRLFTASLSLPTF